MQTSITKTKTKYGNAQRFLIALNPSVQIQVAANLDRAFTGDSPSLNVIKFTYSQEIAESWIMAHLENINDFCGVSQKMETYQMEELAKMILVEYHYFKASELMLFFHRFKCGQYGDFFGVVDAHKILSGLLRFTKDRFSIIKRIEESTKNEQLMIDREKWQQSKTAMNRVEWENYKTKKKIIRHRILIKYLLKNKVDETSVSHNDSMSL